MRLGKYESSDDSHIGTAVTFLLIGMGAGALAALMLAPKSGKQFRRDLKKGYDDAKDTVGDWADEAKDRTRDARDRVREVAKRGADLGEDLPDAILEAIYEMARWLLAKDCDEKPFETMQNRVCISGRRDHGFKTHAAGGVF